MKSSEAPARGRGDTAVRWATVAVLVLSIVAISVLRGRLVARYQQLRTQSDIYALPSPEQLIAVSLGYRAALADVLYANTLVWYGLHFQEKRRFEYVGNYLDAITTLDPSFRAPFLYADTLLVMQPEPARLQDYLKARELLERGMQAFPTDAELWLNAGQYMAYLVAPSLADPAMKERWRLDGAKVLAKACEFVSSNENIPYHCITAAGLLSKAGEREAMAQFVERVLAVSDDEEIRRRALSYLEATLGDKRRERVEFRHKRFQEAWGADLRFVSRDLLLLIGPRFDTARCARSDAWLDRDCSTTWRAWAEHVAKEAPR